MSEIACDETYQKVLHPHSSCRPHSNHTVFDSDSVLLAKSTDSDIAVSNTCGIFRRPVPGTLKPVAHIASRSRRGLRIYLNCPGESRGQAGSCASGSGPKPKFFPSRVTIENPFGGAWFGNIPDEVLSVVILLLLLRAFSARHSKTCDDRTVVGKCVSQRIF